MRREVQDAARADLPLHAYTQGARPGPAGGRQRRRLAGLAARRPHAARAPGRPAAARHGISRQLCHLSE